MPISLGSASFELIADSTQLTGALVEAQATTKTATASMAAAIKTLAAAHQSADGQIKNALIDVAAQQTKTAQGYVQMAASARQRYQEMATAAKQSAQQIQQAHQSITQANTQAVGGWASHLKGALALGAGIAGVHIGLELVKEGLKEVTAAALDAEAAEFSLAKVFGESAKSYSDWANTLADATGQSDEAIKRALVSTKLYSAELGLSAAQSKALVERANDLAAVYGGDLQSAISALEGVLRGNTRAGAAYGITVKGLTDAEQKHLASLGPLETAQAMLAIAMAQTADKAGAASERMDTASGSSARLKRAWDELGESVGTILLPGLDKTSNALASVIEGTTKWVDALHKMPSAQTEAEKGIDAVALAALRAAGPIGGIAAGLIEARRALIGLGVIAGEGPAPAAQAAQAEKPVLGPDPRLVVEIFTRQAKELVAIAERKAQEEYDAEVKRIEATKTALEAEREGRLRVLEQEKDDALESIRIQAEAAQKASEAEIRRLTVEYDEKKKAREQERDDALAGLDAQSQAQSDAADEQVRQLEIVRDKRKKAAEDEADAAIKGLDAEKRARDNARVVEDRQIEDSTRAVTREIQTRHEASVRALEDEAKKADETRDRKIRALEDEARKAQQTHDKRIRHFEDETKAADKSHDAVIRGLEDEAKAAEHAHDAAVDSIEAELKAADATHKGIIRNLEDEQREADRVHQARVDGFRDELDAATRLHDGIVRQLRDEQDEAERLYDQRVRDIEAAASAADDAHRAELDALHREEDERLKLLDLQLQALDAAEREADAADRLAALQRKVADARKALAAAQGTGTPEQIAGITQSLSIAYKQGDQEAIKRLEADLAEAAGAGADAVAAAQQDLTDALAALQKEQVKQATDAEKAKLEAAKATVKSEIALQEGVVDAAYDATKSRLDAEKAAAAEELRILKASTAAKIAAEGDTLDAIKDRVAAEVDAADTAYGLIKDEVALRKQAADDALDLTRTDLAARRDAADAALALVKDDVAARKQAADDELKSVKDRVAGEKQAEDDSLKSTQDRLAKRKQSVQDTYDSEIKGINERKRQEQDAHDAAVQNAQDEAIQAKRKVQDVRDAEDEADRDKRAQIEDAKKATLEAIRAEYDDEATGAIPAIRRAKAASEERLRAQRDDVRNTADKDIEAIADTYTHPEHGLIPLQQRAAKEAAEKFQEMARDAQASFQSQKQTIQDIYSNAAKTGLLDLQDKAKDNAKDTLDGIKKYFEDHRADLTGPDGVVTGTFKDIKKQYDDLLEYIKKSGGVIQGAGGSVNVTQPPFNGDGSGPGAQAGAGATSGGGSNEVPSPYKVSFPFGARYSDPFNSAIPIHRGVDVVVDGAPNGGKGSPVQAFESGEVIYDGYDQNGGNGIIIKGKDGLFHRYFHFDKTKVSVGDEVNKGDVIGILGETGTEGSPHLHYEVSHRSNGDPIDNLIDPVPFMSGGSGGSGGTATGSGTNYQEFSFTIFGRKITVRIPLKSTSLSGTPGAIADPDAVEQWLMAAIKNNEVDADTWLKPLLQLVSLESGGNPKAVNPEAVITDDGVNLGHAKGLLQMLQGTFEENHEPPLPDDIFDPVSNATASVKYIKNHPVYRGDPNNIPHLWDGLPAFKGYAEGAVIKGPTLLVDPRTGRVIGMAGEHHRPERLLGEDETAAYEKIRRSLPGTHGNAMTTPAASKGIATALAAIARHGPAAMATDRVPKYETGVVFGAPTLMTVPVPTTGGGGTGTDGGGDGSSVMNNGDLNKLRRSLGYGGWGAGGIDAEKLAGLLGDRVIVNSLGTPGELADAMQRTLWIRDAHRDAKRR